MHALKFIGRFVLGWVIYSLLLTATLFVREYFKLGVPGFSAGLMNEIWTALSSVLTFLATGFLVYALVFNGLRQWKKLRGNPNLTIFLVVFFHILMGFSFFFTYVFTRHGDLSHSGVEIQTLLGIATILFAIIPYFKKHLFEL